MSKKRGVLVFGIDGGEWRVIKPLIAKGKLPTLAKLMLNGVHSELASTTPPVTAPAWVALATGKPPEANGIFDFQRGKPGDEKPFTADDIDGAALWEILSQRGYRVGIINVPCTWPVRKDLEGYAITGILSPADERIYTPPALKEELEKAGIQYVPAAPEVPEGQPALFVEGLIDTLRKRTKAVEWLIANKPVDFLFMVVRETDSVQHVLWHDKKFIERVYIETDKCLERVLKAHDWDSVFIVSDHGFGPVKGQVLLNNVLEKHGWLVRKKKSPVNHSMLKKIISLPLVRRIAHTMLTSVHRHKIAQTLVGNPLEKIVWDKTRAYCAGNGGQVFVNSEKKDKEKIEKELRAFLEEATDPESGEKLFSKVVPGREVHGPGRHAWKAPDFYAYPADPALRVFPMIDGSGKAIGNAFTNTGDHLKQGIFIAHGKGIKENQTLSEASITDVAPTILTALKEKTLNEMQGRVLDIFSGQPTGLGKEPEKKYLRKQVAQPLTGEEQEQINKQLKGLGYA